MKKRGNKINRARNIALLLIFGGIGVMYLGLLAKSITWLMIIFMLLGLVMVLASSALYFIVGMASTKAIIVTCPNCEKETKMLGRVDLCMYCDEPLTIDRSLEGKEFDEKYNKRQSQQTD